MTTTTYKDLDAAPAAVASTVAGGERRTLARLLGQDGYPPA
jgi:hypothetical protein